MRKSRALLVALVGAACAISSAAAQVQPTPKQTGKIDPNAKKDGKVDPNAKKDGKVDPNAKQDGKIDPNAKVGWIYPGNGALKRAIEFDNGMTATAAERTYATARLDEIDRIVMKAVPEFAHLSYPTWTAFVGFFASAPKSTTILQYDYELVADRCVIFTASINHTPSGAEPWPQGPHGLKSVPGASYVLSELVPPPDPSWEQMLFVRDGETPYHQLTREEARRWQIVDEEGVNGEKLAKRKDILANTPYGRFMAGAAERKATRDTLRIVLKGFRTPAEIDAQIKEMEDAERGAAKELKAQDKDDRRQNDSLSRAGTIADKARASIARMSAADRKLPAWYAPVASDTLFNFGTADTPYGSRLIRPNFEFWTMHRSRVEVRTIDLDFSARCPKSPPPPEVHAALWKLRQNIDWAALKKLVNTP